MGNNCSCFRAKDLENDLTLLSDNTQIKILYNKNTKQFIETLIFLQSRIRGFISRIKFSNKISEFSPKFIPYPEQDLTYVAAENPLITSDDI